MNAVPNTQEKDRAHLDIIGSVQRVFRGPKATKLALRCNIGAGMTLIDVTCFHRPPALNEGDRVHVVGSIRSEKSGMKVTGKNGREYDKWIPWLVADSVELLAERQGRIEGTGPANDNADIDDIPF